MFARFVRMKLKTSAAEFSRTLENDVLPLLKKQKGFRDELTFVAPGAKEAVAVSLWEFKEDAELYNREKYPEVLKIVDRIVEGTPEVKTYEVTNSTLHKIALAA